MRRHSAFVEFAVFFNQTGHEDDAHDLERIGS
jgi:hypothetical protein